MRANIIFETDDNKIKKAHDNYYVALEDHLSKAHTELYWSDEERAKEADRKFKVAEKTYRRVFIDTLNEMSSFISDDSIYCVSYVRSSTKMIDNFMNSNKPFLALGGDFIEKELGYPDCYLLLSDRSIEIDQQYYSFVKSNIVRFPSISSLLNGKYRILKAIDEEIQDCFSLYKDHTFVKKYSQNKHESLWFLSGKFEKHILFFNRCIDIYAQSSSGREDGYGRTDTEFHIYGILFYSRVQSDHF